jgi:flagellar motor protein MotB
MHAQHSALKQHASHTRVQLPSSGFFAFLNKLSGAAANATDFASIRINADWLCVVVSFVCLAFAALEGFAYNNIAQALGWGIPLFLGSLVVTRLYAGHPLTMHINALLLVGMGALHVHISRGLPEYHFSFFMLLPVMLAYRDTRPLLSMGLFIVIHHIVFDMLQQAGFDCYIFRGPFSGLPAVALHSFYIATEVLLLTVIAQVLRQHALAAEESTKLLAYLDKEKGINLRVRAQTDELGRTSPMGQVFNDYADNMAFVVAAFKMLRTDIRELSQIAKELGSDNNQHFEESSLASKKLRDFVQSLGNQTRMGQSTAELSKKVTEDSFDLLNELNQSLEQLQRISKQAFDSSQQIQALHKEVQKELSPGAAQQLQATLTTLDNLNERTNAFMGRMDVLKSGLSAIENQLVSIDRSTHQWVENGHGNQRQGWEVLGAMEGMQTRTESAFRTLASTVQTILRSDDLMREMEKRLSRFDV